MLGRYVHRDLYGLLLIGLLFASASSPSLAKDSFHVEEASIDDLHNAIQKGATTCQGIVQAYIDRVKAYNGICTKLVTKDGAPIAKMLGTQRGGAPLNFPTDTVAIDKILPSFNQYKGMPIEFGRMEPTSSDPTVYQQYGMLAGVANAGQVNALSTINIRGERSVTCKGAYDAKPGTPLPADAPTECEKFRQQPDALEYAAQLDKQYGRHPDLKKMPMYCAVFAFKDVYDTTDMRTTGGADVKYKMDAAPDDSTIVSELRAKGAVIFAKANLAEYNSGSGDPGGAKVSTRTFGAGSRSTWAGVACNPYDTERETGGSSSGSAASVGANLVTCAICEETGGSCRQPAWRNNVVGFVTTKGLLPYGGAVGADPYLDRAGIQCRSVKDAASVLDAIKDPQRGYFDPRDIYTALPKGLISKEPYASFATVNAKKGAKPLAGMRIGIVREYMVKHTSNDVAMSDLVNDEIKKVLRDQLGAELVESYDPAYADDPTIPNMTYNFQQALAEILPFHMPEYLESTNAQAGRIDGDDAAGDADDKDKQRFAVSGYDINSRDYMVKAAEGLAPLSDKLNIRVVTSSPPTGSFSFHIQQYLQRRGDAWVHDWTTLNNNAKYYTERNSVAMKNWENKNDIKSAGITQRVKMREVMRMVVNKVMQQNNLDVLVNPTTTIPPAKNGQASQPTINNRPTGRFPTSADLGIPEITVPAGFNDVIYEPEFRLNAKQDNYTSVANNTTPSKLQHPMPVGISFWAGPGEEPTVIKVASIYEQATKHRMAPAAFGAVTK